MSFLLIKDLLSGPFPQIRQQNENSRNSTINISCNSSVHWPLLLHPTTWQIPDSINKRTSPLANKVSIKLDAIPTSFQNMCDQKRLHQSADFILHISTIKTVSYTSRRCNILLTKCFLDTMHLDWGGTLATAAKISNIKQTSLNTVLTF